MIFNTQYLFYSVPAGVDMILPDAPAEEAFAAITARRAIMFTCGFVATDCAVGAHAIFSLTDAGFCRHVFCEQQHGQSGLRSSQNCYCHLNTLV